MKAVVLTLGCKINSYESEAVAHELIARGFCVTEHETAADLFFVNTCAVTAEAERKCRQTVRRLAKCYPDAKILVAGCSTQNAPSVYLDFKNVVAVGGTYDKCKLLNDYFDGRYEAPQTDLGTEYIHYPPCAGHRTRAFVKIQDGCDRFCSYCIVPTLRGRSRSRAVDEIVREVKGLTAKEIVLTGIDLSAYDYNGADLAELLRHIPHGRIRLGSLEPGIITPRFLEVVAEERFQKHFHLSMQSGSDRVLKAMNRRYTGTEFLEKVALIRSYFPAAGITTDCIAGFPTETEEEHRETLRLISLARFGDMHVFPYSARTGTRAAKMEQVEKAVRLRRAHEIAALARQLHEAFLESWVGKSAAVLTEQERGGFVTGKTSEYIEVSLPTGTPTNELVTVVLTRKNMNLSSVIY